MAIIILLIVVAVVIALDLGGLLHGPEGGSGGPIVFAHAGDRWTIGGTVYRATSFTTSENGTFRGNFSVEGVASTIIIVLMNESEEENFTNNTTGLVGFYDSGPASVGQLNVTVAPAGVYYFYAYNPNTNTVTVDWQTAAEFVPG